MELRIQPALCFRPVAPDRPGGDAEGGGGFFLGHAAEEAALHDPGLAAVEPGKSFESLIERQQHSGAFLHGKFGLLERDSLPRAGALQGVVAPGVVDEDASHGSGGDGKEVRPIERTQAVDGGQPQVGLVDEPGGVERVVVTFQAKLSVSDAAQLVVDEREELFRLQRPDSVGWRWGLLDG